jgi:pimeloyl-ACP methyl ester carboxylesterase
VTAPELLGHGSRTREARPSVTIGDLAEDLAADLPGRPMVLVGHSMGGQVALDLALRWPERVTGVVVVDPAYGAGVTEMSAAPSRLADLRARGAESAVDFVRGAFIAGEPARLLSDVLQDMARTPPGVLADLYESMYLRRDSLGPLPETLRRLGRLSTPVLSLYSTRAAAAQVTKVPWRQGSRIVVWDGVGHYLHLERPRAFADLVQGWLDGLTPERVTAR